MEERVAFASLFESLERILGRQLDGPTATKLRELGIDFARLQPAYPIATWYACIEVAMNRFNPAWSTEEKQHHFGVRLLEVYGETLVGKATYTMMKLIGPERTIQRATRAFRTATNFLETQATMLGPREFEMSLNEVVFPHRYPGFFSKALTLAGAKDADVRLTSLSETHAVFRAQWS